MVNKKENVWDFPRPAICEPFNGSLKVVVSGRVIAKTDRGFRSLETSHPPSYYIPPDDIEMADLHIINALHFANGKERHRILILSWAIVV